MRDYKKLRAFELADELALTVYKITVEFPKSEMYGSYQATQLPIDVLPDLSRPRVIVIAECPGMAPEEVETLVTTPIETYLNGATGITSIRSNSTAGLSMFTIEFDWNVDGFRCRQIVDERLWSASNFFPRQSILLNKVCYNAPENIFPVLPSTK